MTQFGDMQYTVFYKGRPDMGYKQLQFISNVILLKTVMSVMN